MPRRHDHADEKPSAATSSLGPLFDLGECNCIGNLIASDCKRHALTRASAPSSFSDNAPAAPGSKTSAAAAKLASPGAKSQQIRIEQYIQSQGEYGATRGEIGIALGIRRSSVGARVRTSYVQGFVGSNCYHGCTVACDHDPITRIGPEPGDGPQEVLLWETHVKRWAGIQRRPATRAKV